MYRKTAGGDAYATDHFTWKSLVIFSIAYSIILLLSGCSISPEQAKNKAFELYELGKYEKAFPLLENAFTGEFTDPELIVRLAYCRTVVDDNPSGAIELLGDCALRFPDYAPVYYELGQIAYQYGPSEDNKNLLQALDYTRKAAVLDANDYDIITNLAKFHLMLDNLDSALVWFRKAGSIDPDQSEVKALIMRIEALIDQRELLNALDVVDSIASAP